MNLVARTWRRASLIALLASSLLLGGGSAAQAWYSDKGIDHQIEIGVKIGPAHLGYTRQTIERSLHHGVVVEKGQLHNHPLVVVQYAWLNTTCCRTTVAYVKIKGRWRAAIVATSDPEFSGDGLEVGEGYDSVHHGYYCRYDRHAHLVYGCWNTGLAHNSFVAIDFDAPHGPPSPSNQDVNLIYIGYDQWAMPLTFPNV